MFCLDFHKSHLPEMSQEGHVDGGSYPIFCEGLVNKKRMVEARGWKEGGREQTPELFCHLNRI